MNDLEEVRFGVLEGRKVAMESDEIVKACKTAERAQHFRNWFGHYFGEFDTRHLFNTYVFCMSEHGNDDNDGRLSMWRGYGANGNGVAIVIDTAQLDLIDRSPLIVGSVSYGTAEFRRTSAGAEAHEHTNQTDEGRSECNRRRSVAQAHRRHRSQQKSRNEYGHNPETLDQPTRG